jgi:hypothetical protein
MKMINEYAELIKEFGKLLKKKAFYKGRKICFIVQFFKPAPGQEHKKPWEVEEWIGEEPLVESIPITQINKKEIVFTKMTVL